MRPIGGNSRAFRQTVPVRPMTPSTGPIVGVVGGGQLARMMVPAATALGVRLRVLAMDAAESAAQVIPDVVLGRHDDPEALKRLAHGCDVITFDHEHVPQEHLHMLEGLGVILRPGPRALLHAQDKAHMRSALADAGLPVPLWREVTTGDDIADFANEHSWPVVVKTTRGGYDGKGVFVVNDPMQAQNVIAESTGPWLVEQHMPFEFEVCAQVARSPHGQAVAYPVVRTRQVDGICAEVVAPAPGLADELAVEAQRIALEIAALLDVTGMLAVEMFVVGGRLVINELAMRPHNSGHWSIEGSLTSQFENHLRAVLDLPLGDPAQIAPVAVMVNILGGTPGGVHDDLHRAFLHCMAHDPGLKIHIYGKEVRQGRKVGHVSVLGTDVDDLLARGRHAADFMRGLIDG
jgi:5-(carboxyamino)imidazole ribonucleotide synthase